MNFGSTDELNAWNQQIIDEFRANAGVVGGPFEGAPLALVHHTGAKTGTERVTPLVYQGGEGDTVYVFGSKAGATTHPHWYLNLVAHPDTTVEVGDQTRAVTARVLEGDERSKVWEAQKAAMANFAEYDATSGDREIPVVALEPR